MESSVGPSDGHPVRKDTNSCTVGGRSTAETDEWPVVPPVPTPTPPPPAELGPEPPIINRLFDPPAVPVPVLAMPVPARQFPARPVAARQVPPRQFPARHFHAAAAARPGATVALRTRTPRRPVVVPSRADNQVWQPRFAYGSATVVLAGFVVVALPLWLALYRAVGTPGAVLSHILPLTMMLLGGFLAAVSAWVVVVEMRARVRMLDALGRTGEHEAPGAPGISAFTGLLRPLVQVPAQVALLALALSLFIGATILAF